MNNNWPIPTVCLWLLHVGVFFWCCEVACELLSSLLSKVASNKNCICIELNKICIIWKYYILCDWSLPGNSHHGTFWLNFAYVLNSLPVNLLFSPTIISCKAKKFFSEQRITSATLFLFFSFLWRSDWVLKENQSRWKWAASLERTTTGVGNWRSKLCQCMSGPCSNARRL